MNMTDQALVDIILFFILPAWGISGYIDWYCHKKSNIEGTSWAIESVLHSVMGIQVGLPIFLCMLFQVNALILIICIVSLAMHEIVAHFDVRLAVPKRHISILEMHAHNYLATIPLFIFLMIVAINWELLERLLTSDIPLHDQFIFVRTKYVFGGDQYLPRYSLFMLVACVIPYLEELYRCFRYSFRGASLAK